MNLATLNPAQSSRLAAAASAAALRRGKFAVQNKIGAPFGNKNAITENGRDDILHMRVNGREKGQWVDAANLAVRLKTLKPDRRGNLANWVIQTLNAAASTACDKT